MRKRAVNVFFITVMAVLLSALSISADNVTVSAAHEAAVKGLPELINVSPLTNSYSAAAQSTVLADKTSAFQIFTINPEALVSGNVRSESIEATPLYCFLVKKGNQTVGIATVEKIKGEWKILTFGGAGMAAEVNQIFETYSAKEGYSVRYLRSYQSFSDYFEIYKEGHFQGIVPLTSGRMAMGLESNTFNPLEMFRKYDVFSRLGTQVTENLKTFSPSANN